MWRFLGDLGRWGGGTCSMKDLTQCREEMAQNMAEHAQVMLDASLEATSSLDSGQLQTLADALVFHVEVEELGQILRTVTATMDVQQRVEVLLGSTMDRQEAHAPAVCASPAAPVTHFESYTARFVSPQDVPARLRLPRHWGTSVSRAPKCCS